MIHLKHNDNCLQSKWLFYEFVSNYDAVLLQKVPKDAS